MPVPTATERVGQTLADRYHLDQLLARGGMGVLYLGHHLLTGRRVAVKVLRPDDDTIDPTEAQRFLREARTAVTLEHPNVVQVFDVGVDQGSWYLVMELLQGESLADYLLREGPLAPDEALAILLPIMGALAVAHDRGIVHRDVKPENIFLAQRGHKRVPTLLDFGIAKQDGVHTLTERGMALGTPLYMSPEQVRGDDVVGAASDVWSLGVVLRFCLTGKLPFDGQTPAGVLVKILSERAQPVSQSASWVHPPLAECVDRALEPAVDKRHSDMREFAKALVHAAAGAIPLPEDPDPIGLPSYTAWLTHLPMAMTSPGAGPVSQPHPLSHPPAVPAVLGSPEEPSRSGLRRSSKPPSMLRSASGWAFGLAMLALVLAGVIGWLQLRGPGSAPPQAAEAPGTPPAPAALVNEAPAIAPAAASPQAAPPQAPDEAEPVPTAAATGDEADGAEASAPPVRKPSIKKKTNRFVRDTVSRPKRPPVVLMRPDPEPPAAAAPVKEDDDPFTIRRDYKN